jgi:mersacidin/lichenicidin family type 2 lantibiotic
MSTTELIRSWSDTRYRLGLTASELAALDPHPAGDIDAELAQLTSMSGDLSMAASTDLTCSCSCTATHFSSRPCCC